MGFRFLHVLMSEIFFYSGIKSICMYNAFSCIFKDCSSLILILRITRNAATNHVSKSTAIVERRGHSWGVVHAMNFRRYRPEVLKQWCTTPASNLPVSSASVRNMLHRIHTAAQYRLYLGVFWWNFNTICASIVLARKSTIKQVTTRFPVFTICLYHQVIISFKRSLEYT